MKEYLSTKNQNASSKSATSNDLVSSSNALDHKKLAHQEFYEPSNLSEEDYPLESYVLAEEGDISTIHRAPKLSKINKDNTDGASQNSTPLCGFRKVDDAYEIFDLETELQTIELELYEELCNNNLDDFASGSSSASGKEQLRKQNKEGNENCEVQEVQEVHSPIPVHEPGKLKFNPVASTATYVADATIGSEKFLLQKQEEDLRDTSEITATQLSRVSNTKQRSKDTKERIQQANKELFRDSKKQTKNN